MYTSNDLNTFRDAMYLLQRTLTLALVVALAGAFDPWSYFDGGDLGDIIIEKPNDVGLCPSLISMMDNLSADNTFKCQPLPSHVRGKVPEFCNFAAVDTVRGCRGAGNVTSCLGGALEVRDILQILAVILYYRG